MRHRNIGRYFNRNSSQRKALFLNLSKQLINNKFLRTTLEKAKELRRFVEPLVTLSKVDSLHNRRIAFSKLRDKKLVYILFADYGKKYLNRPGGYLRILKYGIRKGDGAKLAFVEFVDSI